MASATSPYSKPPVRCATRARISTRFSPHSCVGALEDGLDPSEVNKTLVSVFQRPAREAASGQGGRRPKRPTLRNRKPVTYTTAPKGNYELKKRELPRPIENGAVELLRVAFNEGENVRIVMSTLEDNESGRPANEGTTLDREWWLERLIKLGGNLDSYDKKGGIFIGINPMTAKGCRDEHVTKFRHVLVELDDIPTHEEQWHLINEAKLPCKAVISSGNKSLHAWVRVDAKNLARVRAAQEVAVRPSRRPRRLQKRKSRPALTVAQLHAL